MHSTVSPICTRLARNCKRPFAAATPLSLGGERRKSQAQSENDRKPDPRMGTSVEDGCRGV